MCTICGGTSIDERFLKIFNLSLDRGRDYSNVFYRKGSWICNHRAVPTTEVQNAEFNQPFGTDYKIVHNGTISNDKELGNPEGFIDSYILSKVLDFTNLERLRDSLYKVVGAYAIAVLKPNGTFYLACNYKPIFYCYTPDGNFYFSSYEHHLQGMENVKRLEPYTVMDCETKEILPIERKVYDRAIVIASAGLDSTAVAAYACSKHKEVTLLHYNYGCLAETPELIRIKKIQESLNKEYNNCSLYVMDLDLKFMAHASTLMNGQEKITEGIAGSEYAHEWVPARNLIMLSMAVGYAEANDFSYIYLGTNLEEGGAYPDNENQFIKDFNSCLYGAVQNGKYVEIRTPVGNMMKHEIVPFGLKYKAPFEHTWSCYRNGEKACGHCGPCFMRQTAFHRNGLVDPVEYEERMNFT
jgi:7-cyano-7-deazaguanine synthase